MDASDTPDTGERATPDSESWRPEDWNPGIDWPTDELGAAHQALGDVIVEQRLPKNTTLDSAQRALKLAVDLFTECNRLNRYAPVALEAEVVGFYENARRVRIATLAIHESRQLLPDVERELDLIAREIPERLETFIQRFGNAILASYTDEFRPLLPILGQTQEALEARKLTEQTRQARDQAVEALQSTRRAAGATGEASLASHFGEYARRERRTMNWLRGATAAVLVGITSLAAALLFRSTDHAATSADELAKLTISIPLVVLAAYLGREASRHRTAAQWASELEVQLLTVDAFSEPLSDQAREQLRAELGRRVFTTHAVPDSDDRAPSAIDEASGLLANVAGLLKATGGDRKT